MSKKLPEKKWHYSLWMGVMYGSIPVGLIVVALLMIIYFLQTR